MAQRRRCTQGRLVEALRAADLKVAHVFYLNRFLLTLERVRGGADPQSDVSVQSHMLNRLLTPVLRQERRMVTGRALPVRVSLVAVAHRADWDLRR